jgi:hypothetical protein
MYLVILRSHLTTLYIERCTLRSKGEAKVRWGRWKVVKKEEENREGQMNSYKFMEMLVCY